MARFIGIRHRVKRTAEGEAHPTQICILDGEQVIKYDLETESDELDWLQGVFPRKMRAVTAEDDLSHFRPHQITWKELKKGEEESAFPAHLIKREGKSVFVAKKVPEEFDGLRIGDTVAMTLGGSGDAFAFAASIQGEKIDVKIMRCQPIRLKQERERLGLKDDSKETDSQILAQMVQSQPDVFYELRARDRDLIRIRVGTVLLSEILKERVACEQRLHQRVIGQVFCHPEGIFPQGGLEKAKAEAEANDLILANLKKEERRRETELTKDLEAFNVYVALFQPIKGVGPRIASRIISCVQDIRRFPRDTNMKKFFGVAPDNSQPRDLQFPRKRRNQELGYNPAARQALYLLGDQFNRRPESEWGQKLIAYKAKLRAAHPDVMCKACGCKMADCPTPKAKGHVKLYTDGHIHKMAIWRTLTKFIEWLHSEWWKLEKEPADTKLDSAVNQ